jgi:superfamily II DNA/RNA helicase
VLACAMTGSGKTAAFALPILHRLMDKKRGTTRALVLTPTRELAAQIDEHTRELAARTTSERRRPSETAKSARVREPSLSLLTGEPPLSA